MTQETTPHGKSTEAADLLKLSFLLLALIIALVMLLIIAVPLLAASVATSKDILLQLAGAALGFLTGLGGLFARNISSAFDFWWGSSAGSKQKDANLQEALSGQTDKTADQLNKFRSALSKKAS
ncbi:hypothetical protein E1162_18865 [Rhodobacteraceae bacterium RKSG542]|uniref:hypothetical protein n=1 Tax=Pseudovibrio flavus TaxID=2529854 RepID=UPI0012BB9AC3|nr:hypothetical protein [Pseudovibrio flavus]MTI19309.1 hypothetical protein [Pseudovibrio flavus]